MYENSIEKDCQEPSIGRTCEYNRNGMLSETLRLGVEVVDSARTPPNAIHTKLATIALALEDMMLGL